MEEVLIFLLLGVGYGGLISGTGIGVVLSYRGSGVINLAVGAFAMLSGYCFYSLTSGYFGPHVATVPAVIATLVFAVVLGAVFEFLVIVPLRTATPLAKLVGSLGFLIAAMAAVTLGYGDGAFSQNAILPVHAFHLFGAPLLLNRFLIVAIVLAIALVTVGAYRFTRFGLGTRAASENELHSMLVGLSPRWISLANTVLMSLTMAVLGLLAASVQVLDPTDLPLLVVPGLAAALFGSLSSLTITFVAGTIMGALESLLVYASTLSWFPTVAPYNPIPGVQEMLTFVILLVAVSLRGGRIPGRGEILERKLPPAPRPRAPLRSALVFGVPVGVCLWLFPEVYRVSLLTSLIWALLLLSIVLVTGFVGQVSAVQLALGGVAGFATGEITMYLGIGFPFAPILGVLAAAIVGLLLGIPALRVRGVSLVIVTLAAAVAFNNFLFGNARIDSAGAFLVVPKWFGFTVSPLEIAPFNGEIPTFWFCLMVLVLLVIAGLFVCNVRRSHTGQEMLAVRANERAASAIGINVRNTKLVGFTLAAAIAGLAGVLLSYSYGAVSLGQLDNITTLSLIAFAYIGGITTVPGSMIAGLLLTGNLLTVFLQRWFGIQPNWTTLGAGLVLVAVLVWVPGGISGAVIYHSGESRLETVRSSVRKRLARDDPVAPGPAPSGPADAPARLEA